uniref:Uncharacterized protein n=1 Tax=Physcomitrium patens TaxID=3218 RepID=A0A2K1KJA9_PHYPA|nr:hypothetical protein PHYPA_007537 [Physcomitrium patens]
MVPHNSPPVANCDQRPAQQKPTEVQELIQKEVQDELAPVVPEKKVEVPSMKTIQKKQVVPNYDVVEDLKGEKANVTFGQLLADSKPYRKLVTSSLRHTNAKRKRILPTVFHVEQEDLRSPKIDVKIAGCILKEVPVDSRSGVNIMTEETAHDLGYHDFKTTPRMLRLADQTRRKPAGILQNIETLIGGVPFKLTYIIIRPIVKKGYKILIGRPWLYRAKVKTNSYHHELKFKDLRGPAQKPIIVSWKKVPHLGETPPSDQGYTSETSETSSIDLKDPYDVSYLTCYLVDEDEEDSGNEDLESEKNLDLARLEISSTSHVEGIVNPDDCLDIDLDKEKTLKVSKYITPEELQSCGEIFLKYHDIFAWSIE